MSRKKRTKEAYLFWNAGAAYVIDRWTQNIVSESPTGDHKGAIYRARKKGYDVGVYTYEVGTTVYSRFK